ncbi:MAG: ParB/RepB/Spo0J family partition protein [Acidobacteriota bacterium]
MSSDNAPAGETDRRRTVSGAMPIHEIKPRPHGDTRTVDQTHVESLAESIGVLGLLNPITVDLNGNLIAGAHRLAALEILHTRGEWQDPVPVTIYPANVASNAKLALDLEVSENDKRRDYTSEEIRALARRLKAAGYRADCGRPRRGEKAMIPALMVIVGKSKSQVLRALAGGRQATRRRSDAASPLGDVTSFPSPVDRQAREEREEPLPGPSLIESVASRVAALRPDAERTSILPLDDWSVLAPDAIEALTRDAEDLAEVLHNVAIVARSAISMIGEHDDGSDDDEVIDEEAASS